MQRPTGAIQTKSIALQSISGVYRFCQSPYKQNQCTDFSSTTKSIVINDIYGEMALSLFLGAKKVPGPCGWISDSLYHCKLKYVDCLDQSVRNEVCLPWLKLRLAEAHNKALQDDELLSMKTAFCNANLHDQVLQSQILLGESIDIEDYCNDKTYTPDWCALVLLMQHINRQDVKRFALELVALGCISVAHIMSVLLGGATNCDKTRIATEFLFAYLCPDADIMRLLNRGYPEPEDFDWDQCKDFQRLCGRAVDVITQIGCQYDKNKLTHVCESMRLYRRALAHCDHHEDKQRMLRTSSGCRDVVLQTVHALLLSQCEAKKHHALDLAREYSEQLQPKNLIMLFEKTGCWDELVLYLAPIVSDTRDSYIIRKFIMATVQLDMFSEYLQAGLKFEHLSIFTQVCREHNYVKEMVEYLSQNKLHTDEDGDIDIEKDQDDLDENDGDGGVRLNPSMNGDGLNSSPIRLNSSTNSDNEATHSASDSTHPASDSTHPLQTQHDSSIDVIDLLGSSDEDSEEGTIWLSPTNVGRKNKTHTIFDSDYARLCNTVGVEAYLNDTIINFYLDYIYASWPTLFKKRVLIMHTFFWKTLQQWDEARRKGNDKVRLYKQRQLERWVKRILLDYHHEDALFNSIEYIIIPRCINNAHWQLTIICNAGRENVQTKPWILNLNSIGSRKTGLQDTYRIIRDWLNVQNPQGGDVFTASSIEGISICVPSQGDVVNCGNFLLRSVQQFGQEEGFADMSSKQTMDRPTWYTVSEGTALRMEIKTIINRLRDEQKK